MNEIRAIDLLTGKARKKLIRRFAAAGIDPASVTMKPEGDPTLGSDSKAGTPEVRKEAT